MLKNKTGQQLHEQYKKGIKRDKRSVFIWQLTILVLLFGLWQLASSLLWIDPLLFSSPSKIITQIIDKFADGSFFVHLQATVVETIIGFVLGTLLGVILATVLWTSSKLSKITDPYLVVANAMPKVALGPIIIVALGPGYTAIIAMGALISVVITTLVVYSAFREVDPNYVNVLKSFGASRFQCFREAVFPATLPTIISTLKVNVGLSWVGIIVGEFLVSKQGLGYLIIYGFQVFDFTLVMSSLLLIAICAAIMYKFVEKMEHVLMKHNK
ncbi:ABC transporter permease [Virgibacillus phasianinus]|uniref:ABC transporter permease n=1 Tax=Virgibacillus phasianinus TaxID=2017483 RepID=A0A220U458_9BACI|nr:ABC transporter permease [Virgibacillus phasianinus]ASK62897.1 ABC transporter permease [Virgibacillus phasianinus]